MWNGANFKSDKDRTQGTTYRHVPDNHNSPKNPVIGHLVGVITIMVFIAIISFADGSRASAHSKTVFQEISAGLEILGGFVCLAAAAVVLAIYSTYRHSQAAPMPLTGSSSPLNHEIIEISARLARVEGAIKRVDDTTALALKQATEDAAAAKEARDRTNQLLEWIGTGKQGQ